MFRTSIGVNAMKSGSMPLAVVCPEPERLNRRQPDLGRAAHIGLEASRRRTSRRPARRRAARAPGGRSPAPASAPPPRPTRSARRAPRPARRPRRRLAGAAPARATSSRRPPVLAPRPRSASSSDCADPSTLFAGRHTSCSASMNRSISSSGHVTEQLAQQLAVVPAGGAVDDRPVPSRERRRVVGAARSPPAPPGGPRRATRRPT